MRDVKKLLAKLTLPEKVRLLEGVESWKTHAIPRLGIRALYLTDGPLGVRRKHIGANRGAVGLGRALPATLFPAPATLAASFDPALCEETGRAMGREAAALGVDVLLAPAMNVKRDPRCGRNFEYYSEDPLLTGKMAAAFSRGAESAGTAACLKHFALNNTESFRYMRDSVADERTLREIYLRAFEIAVREGKPGTVMCAYNRVNGIHASENKRLLTDILRKEWGYRGLVMTDWGATRDRVAGVAAGCDLDMPGGILMNREALLNAVRKGTLPEKTLNRAVMRVLRLEESAGPAKRPAHADKLFASHRALSRRAAEESAVLLQNDGVLPLKKGQRILAVGGFFRHMRVQGAGSSSVNPRYLVEPEEAFRRAGIPYRFAEGFYPEDDRPDPALEREAVEKAEKADVILLFLGLGRHSESEGADRPDLSLPGTQLSLLEKMLAAGKKTAVVLFGGGVVDAEPLLPANAVLYAALPGGEGGEALRRILFGEADPGGRLAESWIRSRDLLPPPKDHRASFYKEGIFVGYRYYASRPGRVLFPFGHGLSYTEFRLSEMRCGSGRVEATVENTGERPGSTVVELYIGHNPESVTFGEEKRLAGFRKVRLLPGEKERVVFPLAADAFRWYHAPLGRFVVEKGTYPVELGFSSEDIRLCAEIAVPGEENLPPPVSRRVKAAYERNPRRIPDGIFGELLGRPLPKEEEEGEFDLESPLLLARKTGLGRAALDAADLCIRGLIRKAERMPRGRARDEAIRNRLFLRTILTENSLRSMIQSSGGAAQMHHAHALAHLANGRYGKALSALFRKPRKKRETAEDAYCYELGRRRSP